MSSKNIEKDDGYVDKLRKTIPGDLTAIYLSFRVVVASVYDFVPVETVSAESLAESLTYVTYLVRFMLPLSLVAMLYLYFVSEVTSIIQIVVIIISYIFWMVSLDINAISFVLQNFDSITILGPYGDIVLRDRVTFIGITLLWTFSIPVIYSIAQNFGWMGNATSDEGEDLDD
ncbi:hypothetical protein [uncultured Roseibium sp.]|uniref:hypothetical protein n=1 Tax=uncultured Roseibium sp. TaxID=1936171 RepID=UPI0026144E26|nr:hypothetical protein [uncultured Roseibium sp.]